MNGPITAQQALAILMNLSSSSQQLVTNVSLDTSGDSPVLTKETKTLGQVIQEMGFKNNA